ncbi:MAG: LPS biosynthesis protein [Candidatus Muiribacterium halophilum]|uniref:LPS biosynthesis protein n=1 Tax=Muiribacterium halophilum TaxID=2053465 RepID=A0A2N5ZJ79_MUIH1|nr:MAG: LPS biosynthesis protein [Candidatus Muirbacterium halophilum]
MKKTCTRCLYHEDIPNITFDEQGVCNYCRQIEDLERQYPIGDEGEKILDEIFEQIKKDGKGKKYDCVVGVSGGCDSSYLVYKCVQKGLRPLAVHFDNTWNSTIATQNIRKVLDKLGVDLFTYVVNNKEYDDIYRSFLQAGTPDTECPTDIGLATTLNMAAAKHGVKYVIEGHNFRTEGVCPLGWLYMDGKYIESVHKKYGKLKMKTYPNMPMYKFLKWMIIDRIKKIRPLWYMSYNKEEVKTFLQKEFDWKWYGGHHLENRFTAFYHSYLIPKRFNRDYRLLGFSALIRSGQMSREEGMKKMQEPPYLEPELLEYVKKRLGYSDDEFEKIMKLPKRTYKDFKTYKKTFERMRPFFYVMAKLSLVPYSFYMKYTKPQE